MAPDPGVALEFGDGCPDCGRRRVDLPATLPSVGDDFDWLVRDYDGFRRFLLEELAARFPERRRWTPADVEVALAEVLAFVLDQLSDMLDRVAGEAYLETARRPETVRRLLRLIGYDAVTTAQARKVPPFDSGPVAGDLRSDAERLEQRWLDHPSEMDSARLEGPRAIHTQRRMVTLEDHVTRLEEHPLVKRAHARDTWGGSWSVIRVAVIPGRILALEGERRTYTLDLEDVTYSDEEWALVETFHAERDLPLPDQASRPTLRTILRGYLDAYRMVGQEVQLTDALQVGVTLSISIQVNEHYFRSEVQAAAEKALGTGPGGFFEPGRLRFGEDLHAGDLFEVLMSLDGVENVCLNRFKRLGSRFADQSDTGQIVLRGLEVAVCNNDPKDRNRGYYTLQMVGGRRG
jgi:hypothetical protein